MLTRKQLSQNASVLNTGGGRGNTDSGRVGASGMATGDCLEDLRQRMPYFVFNLAASRWGATKLEQTIQRRKRPKVMRSGRFCSGKI
jgi:hypothetical protein